MLYSKRKSLEDQVIELVIQSPLSIKELHERVAVRKSALSLRAVYKATTHLIAAGVLLKAGKKVRIDEEWVGRVKGSLSSQSAFSLVPGEKISHTFISIEHLDAFWKTIYLGLEREERDGQVFFYNPHNFWAYLPERKESEDAYYGHFSGSKTHAYFTVGGSNKADREFKRTYQNEFLQIDTKAMPSISRTDHVTIYGDYVLTVRIGKKLAASIDKVYGREVGMAQILPDLLAAVRIPSKIRFMIENNPAKAAKLKKKLSLNFYFRKRED